MVDHRSSLNEVWKLIEPVVPDVLVELQAGVYEARWWKPVPWKDVEMLLHTEVVIVVVEPYEPAELPNGCAVRFSVALPV